MFSSIFLADFSVIKPEPGLIFWTFLVFVIYWLLIGLFDDFVHAFEWQFALLMART